MVSALTCGLGGLGLSPCEGYCVVTLVVPPLNPVVLMGSMLGVTLRWTSIPSREE